jgi:hypothetical protein
MQGNERNASECGVETRVYVYHQGDNVVCCSVLDTSIVWRPTEIPEGAMARSLLCDF